MVCVLIRIASSKRSNEHTQHTIIVEKIEKISLSYLHLLPDLIHHLPLVALTTHISEQIFHGPRDVRAIKVRL